MLSNLIFASKGEQKERGNDLFRNSCKKITDRGLASLAEGLKGLSSIKSFFFQMGV